MKKLLLMFICFLAIYNADGHSQIKTVKIGKQVWMAENLSIDVPGSWFYNGNEEYGKKYGRLYTWNAALKACPKGWHLPTDAEWDELTTFLGGEDVVAKELKPRGTSGFNALLAGMSDGHTFRFIDTFGGFWSASAYDTKHAWYRYFTNKDNSLTSTYFSKQYGFCVRCVKD